MFLSNDVCRCMDKACGVRFTCGRFVDNVDKSDGERIPYSGSLKDEDDDQDLPCDLYIECCIIVDIDDGND